MGILAQKALFVNVRHAQGAVAHAIAHQKDEVFGIFGAESGGLGIGIGQNLTRNEAGGSGQQATF
jgi:hypothetical protein